MSRRGQITTTDPIKDLATVARIKESLQDNPRDLALFTLGVNSAFRAGDILKLTRADLVELPDGRIEVFVRERKTHKLRRVTLNPQASETLRRHLATSTDDRLFPVTIQWFGKLVKRWCAEAGLEGRFATHTLRKTFARLNYEVFGVSLATLAFALNHDSERTTMRYLGLVDEDVARVYQNSI